MVCPLTYLKNRMPKLHESFSRPTCYLYMAMCQFSTDECCVLPVFWMTSHFHMAYTDNYRHYSLAVEVNNNDVT